MNLKDEHKDLMNETHQISLQNDLTNRELMQLKKLRASQNEEKAVLKQNMAILEQTTCQQSQIIDRKTKSLNFELQRIKTKQELIEQRNCKI